MSSDRHARAPLFEALVRHARRARGWFHVPGHRGGPGFDPRARHWFAPLLRLDVTELPGLDDLHQPEGVIAEAQALAAEAFGAEETFFLVGGSTVGNLAMVWATCRPGDKILVARNSHKSVFHAVRLAGAVPVVLAPRYAARWDVPVGVDADLLDRALHAHPDAKAVLVTNPTYYGMAVDVAALTEVAHARGVPLLVDEAHGAHFAFTPGAPPTALASGADAVVQSAHKTLGAMTMGAYLHVQGNRIDRHRLREALRMLQTSSPSYPVLASLDLARRHAVLHGRAAFAHAAEQARCLRARIHRFEGLAAPDPAHPEPDWAAFDPLKVLVHLEPKLRRAGGTGYALADHLARAGVYVELADPVNVLLLLTAGTEKAEVERVEEVLAAWVQELLSRAPAEGLSDVSDRLPPPVYPPVSVVSVPPEGAQVTAVPLEAAVGLVSAEMIVPYPPGVPAVLPGERFGAETVAHLCAVRDGGGHIQGAADPTLNTVRVWSNA
ncbi:MAG TPA: aminotransferase class I/II-fold pyridoxal phosphate-dependent enzyme [Calditerricola sp.]